MFEIEAESINGRYVWAVVLKVGVKKLSMLSSPDGDSWATETEALHEGAYALAFALSKAIDAGKLTTV